MVFIFKADSPYWRNPGSPIHKCVLLSLSGKDWGTASCEGRYPYICFQKPPSKKHTLIPVAEKSCYLMLHNILEMYNNTIRNLQILDTYRLSFIRRVSRV